MASNFRSPGIFPAWFPVLSHLGLTTKERMKIFILAFLVQKKQSLLFAINISNIYEKRLRVHSWFLAQIYSRDSESDGNSFEVFGS